MNLVLDQLADELDMDKCQLRLKNFITSDYDSNDEYIWGVTPCITFWQSEFVFLRLQYSFYNPNEGKNENMLLLQSTWSVGPHKHEAY